MLPEISKITELKENISTAFIFSKIGQVAHLQPEAAQSDYLRTRLEKNDSCVIHKHPLFHFFCHTKEEKDIYQQTEAARKAGAKLFDLLKQETTQTVQIGAFEHPGHTLAFLEGLLLAAYVFDKYKKQKEDFELKTVYVLHNKISQMELEELKNLVQAVFHARNLVNESLSFLTAIQFSNEMKKLGNEAGFAVEVLRKQKIEALKMGGLLAVNKGSIDPPTFTIMEWKPANAKNMKPVVLVGKGVVFDTGGLSLKPTAKSMDYMKCDMAGGAVVAATLFAAAKNKLPLHVLGLVPATDNRPDGNAYVPGDIITMFDGTSVEIKNTDAEGRLILADALSYAKKYNPELVIDVATLTGAAEMVAGNCAIVAMGNTPEFMRKLEASGRETYERIVEVPLWEEYAVPLKSAVADLNNLGSREAQSSVAGKFLEHFTNYNWIHLDTAGVSFRFEKENYLSAGGTAFGTRLLFNFLKKIN